MSNPNGVERRATNNEVVVLTEAVQGLRGTVADLNDLIVDSLAKAEHAEQLAQKKPSRLTLYALIVMSILVALGFFLTNQATNQRLADINYEKCLQRNAQLTQSQVLQKRLALAVRAAAERGDLLAKELDGLLEDQPVPPPDCEKIPHS